MKFAVLAMVKNEVDIIESFVRHNLQFADEMFILDNGSTDNTFVILEHLKSEGLPIHLFQDNTTGHQQQKLSTDLLHNIKNKTDADIFMFLDADEFICIHPNSPAYSFPNQYKEFFQSQLAKVQQLGSYAIKWLNYLPIESNQNDYINQFNEFYECDQTLMIHQKVIYSRNLLDKIILTQGNHCLFDKYTNERINQMVFDDIALAHFPVRSPKQIINKMLTTAIAVNSRKVDEGESFHVFDMRNKFIANNYQLSIDECRELARTYGIPPHYQGEVVLGHGKVNPHHIIELHYLNLNNLNIIHSLRSMAEETIEKNKILALSLEEKQKTITSQDNELEQLKYTLANQNKELEHLKNVHSENDRLNHQLTQININQTRYKRLFFVKLFKPFIKLEQGLHSLNRYRKAFRILMREKGSFGKAYQHIRRHTKKYGFYSSKQLLKQLLHATPKPPSILLETAIPTYTSLEHKSCYQPKVSIIVPNYNHEKYIIERLNSILNQDYKNIELIILDDNSTDNSVQIIKEYFQGKSIDYQLIVNKKNAGNVFKQWKKGFELATGDLIWICESDDSCEPNFLSQIVPYFNQQAINIAFGRIQLIDADGRLIDGLDNYRENAESGIWNDVCIRPAFEWFNNAFGVNNIYANVSGGVIRRQLLNSSTWNKATEFKIYGDWFLYLHLAGAGKIAYIPTAISYFRQHPKNTSASNFNQLYYYEEHFKILNEILKIWVISRSTQQRFIDSIEKQYQYIKMDDKYGAFDEVFAKLLTKLKSSHLKNLHVQIYFLGFHPGGGELFPIVLANQLKVLGHTVSMVALDLETINDGMKNKLDVGIPVYHLSELMNNPSFFRNLGVDVIHTHIVGADLNLINYFEKNNLSIPYVVTMHGSHDRSFDNYSIKNTKKMIHYVSKWVYIADKNLDFFQGFNVNNIKKFPNAMPVDYTESNHSRASLGIKENDIVFAFAARGIFEKGWVELVEAFMKLKKEGITNAHLVLMGSGEAQQEAQRIANNDSNIHFLGFEPSVNSVLRFSDCLVLPSRFAGESYPLCLVQAIQEGLPCIATNIGEIENILTSENGEKAGILIPLADTTDNFIAHLQAALLTMCDNAKRNDFQKTAKKLSSRYDLNKLANQYIDLYKSIIQESNFSKTNNQQ